MPNLSVVQKMNQLASLIKNGRIDPLIRDTALKVIRGLAERNELSEAKALFSFVRDRIRYVRDPYGEDVFEDARFTLSRRSGDCDATTVLLGSLLQSVGFPYRIKVFSKDGRRFTHVAGQVGLPKSAPQKWVTVDASAPRPMGWENPVFKYSKILQVN